MYTKHVAQGFFLDTFSASQKLLLSMPGEEVMTENPFEIPQALREQAEQNMKQAHAAYEQLTDFVTKAMDAWMGAMPSPMAADFKDVQGRAMQIAKENAESIFTFAGKISNVQNPQDIVTLQTQFAQDRMQAFATQTQELYRVIGETIHKFETGALGAEMSAMPSPMTADFKDVQARAMNIAMEFSESALTFAGKISHAQTFQDIVTLQTQFAQDRMQAFATQTQELYKLIGETVQKLQRG
jgi:hypothetical protein